MKDYRELIIRTIEILESSVVLTFSNSVITLEVTDKNPLWSSDLKNLKTGDKILVRGKSGNRDVDLFGVAIVESLLTIKR